MRIVVIALIFLTNTNIHGQINVGPIEYVKLKTGEFEQANLNKLKSSKTLFVYRNSDIVNLELFKSTLKEVWDYNELEFISYEEYSSNTYDENYSFFTIGGLHKVKTSSSGMVSEYTYIYLTLWMNNGNEKLTFCRIELYPTFVTFQKANMYVEDDVNLMMDHLYEESKLHNWNFLYLKNALQLVNEKLSKSDEHWLFNCEVYSDLSHLKNNTLYIPEYTLIKFAAFTGDESKRHNVKKLFKNYPYPYKILSMEELSEKALHSEKPLYYLSYIKSCTDKFVSVVNAKTGELLYSDYSPASYNIKDKNLKKLAKKIKQSG
tara:strand:- start:76 stop:1032 length:957 start_codon:yes stop_codon:yes gene_type:complete